MYDRTWYVSLSRWSSAIFHNAITQSVQYVCGFWAKKVRQVVLA